MADGEQTECGATLAGGTDDPPDDTGGGDDQTPDLPARDNPLDSPSAKVLLAVVGLAAFALIFALVAIMLTGRENAAGVVIDETLDLAEMMAQEEAFASTADEALPAGEFTSPAAADQSAPVLDGSKTTSSEPVIKDMRDDKVARDDGVHGAAQLDGFAFEGWTLKQVQESLASGWTMEQLQELHKKGKQP